MSNSDVPEAQIVASAGGRNSPLIIQRSAYKGIRTIDVRKHYRDKNTGDLKPTRKGITLTQNQYLFLQSIFEERHADLIKWFDEGVLSADGAIHRRNFIDHIKEDKSAVLETSSENARTMRTKRSLSSRHESWSSPELFYLESKGNEETTVLNDSNPWIAMFRDTLEKMVAFDEKQDRRACKDQLNRHLAELFAGFVHASYLCSAFVDDIDDFTDTISANWGLATRSATQ